MDPEETLQNKDPAFIGAIFSNVLEILQLYGWFILIALGAVYFLYSRIQPWIYRVSQKIQEDQYKKLDEGTIHSRMEAMERARLKMQENLDEQARQFAEQQKIKDEKKRQEKIEDWERHQQGKGYRSKTKAPEEKPATPSTLVKPKPKKTLRPDYNPLSGNDGASCFRPSRKGGASGGG